MKTIQHVPYIPPAKPARRYTSEELTNGTAPEGVYTSTPNPNPEEPARMIVIKRIKGESVNGGKAMTSETTVLCFYNDGTLHPGSPADWAGWFLTDERVVFNVVPK